MQAVCHGFSISVYELKGEYEEIDYDPYRETPGLGGVECTDYGTGRGVASSLAGISGTGSPSLWCSVSPVVLGRVEITRNALWFYAAHTAKGIAMQVEK